MPIADFTHTLEIAWNRRDRAHGGAYDRLGDKSHDILAAQFPDLGIEFLAEPFAVSFRGLVATALAIFVDRRHMMGFDQ